MNDRLLTISQNLNVIDGIAQNIFNLAVAFSTVGNQTLADDLLNYAKLLHQETNNINNKITDSLNDGLQVAGQGVTDTLRSFLTAIK